MPKKRTSRKYNIHALATQSAKNILRGAGEEDLDFSEGSDHDKLRDQYAERMKGRREMTEKPVNPKTGKIIKELGRTKLDQFISYMKVFRGL